VAEAAPAVAEAPKAEPAPAAASALSFAGDDDDDEEDEPELNSLDELVTLQVGSSAKDEGKKKRGLFGLFGRK
ncbi:MAG: hypothetical protein J6C09_04445, partial [Clostridia bacterium]|nr:hypothetical protein [Clostridia bacterium]